MHFAKEGVLSRGIVRGFEPSRTRTCDPLVKSQLLYQLSYRPIHAESTLRRALLICEERRAFYLTETPLSELLHFQNVPLPYFVLVSRD